MLEFFISKGMINSEPAYGGQAACVNQKTININT